MCVAPDTPAGPRACRRAGGRAGAGSNVMRAVSAGAADAVAALTAPGAGKMAVPVLKLLKTIARLRPEVPPPSPLAQHGNTQRIESHMETLSAMHAAPRHKEALVRHNRAPSPSVRSPRGGQVVTTADNAVPALVELCTAPDHDDKQLLALEARPATPPPLAARVSYPVLSCSILFYPVLSHPILFYPILPCPTPRQVLAFCTSDYESCGHILASAPDAPDLLFLARTSFETVFPCPLPPAPNLAPPLVPRSKRFLLSHLLAPQAGLSERAPPAADGAAGRAGGRASGRRTSGGAPWPSPTSARTTRAARAAGRAARRSRSCARSCKKTPCGARTPPPAPPQCANMPPARAAPRAPPLRAQIGSGARDPAGAVPAASAASRRARRAFAGALASEREGEKRGRGLYPCLSAGRVPTRSFRTSICPWREGGGRESERARERESERARKGARACAWSRHELLIRYNFIRVGAAGRAAAGARRDALTW
jgi:hypothetical protein